MTTAKRRYYEVQGQGQRPSVGLPMKLASHSEFLRTGRISRSTPIWMPDERQYLSYAEVAARTGRKLETAGEKTHERINGFHRAIQFPKMVFHHTLEDSPHLGYCHVTAAYTRFAEKTAVNWSFYIANFFSEIGEEEMFFEKIVPQSTRMYFAVATQNKPGQPMEINRSLRKNGVLFQTTDPKEAMKNILMLGAPDEAVRAIIKKL